MEDSARYETGETRPITIRTIHSLSEVDKKLLTIADIVAKRHFVWLSPIPQVADAQGTPIPVIDTMAKSSAASGFNPMARPIQEAANDPEVIDKRVTSREANSPKILYAQPIRQLMDLFAGNIVAVGQAMVDAAIGYKVIRRNPETGEEVEVYEREPDAKVGELILSRLMGKPEVNKTVEHIGNQSANVVIYIPNNERQVKDKTGRPIRPTAESFGSIPEPPPPTPDENDGRTATVYFPEKVPASYSSTYADYTDTADIVEEDYRPGNGK